MYRSIVVDKNGIIVAVGPDAEISNQFKDSHFEKEIDATGNNWGICLAVGCCVLPGLVDAHTHVAVVFANNILASVCGRSCKRVSYETRRSNIYGYPQDRWRHWFYSTSCPRNVML